MVQSCQTCEINEESLYCLSISLKLVRNFQIKYFEGDLSALVHI